MIWTADHQARLNLLRHKELAGTLLPPEQTELADLMAQVEQEEAGALAPTLDALRERVRAQELELSALQSKNEELARLLAQQRSLAADGRRFLAEFDQRRASILDALAQLGADPLPAT